jgi:hypothetical protein
LLLEVSFKFGELVTLAHSVHPSDTFGQSGARRSAL